ncbi:MULTISPECIES: electron transfer flavoprotein subunit alpha/FixB family protein [Metallosphaera]|uniref:electron transfer flavoprotein subunit alpha/FixB family protein n=1 Tax=Metallosphaera TaxID=41980 RepID=UPI001F056E58|nr:electron transfer flavoprotein subunit alpha/FixB family protein [Metallosphaera sedula]MCH1771092.1 electron transfer flavoprotein subunit alpha/FixB family protein [Metallosphaera sedula]MCP6729463.1 electron transfer flavoprotein subunit alpha/FixB family protein [Metallosphaera sedula]
MRILVVSEDPDFFRSSSWIAQQIGGEILGIHPSESRYVDKLFIPTLEGAWELPLSEFAYTLKPDVVIAGGTKRDRTFAFSLAGKLKASVASDVMEAKFEGQSLLVKRPVYSGVGIATLRLKLPAVITVQKNTMEPNLLKGEVEKVILPSSSVVLKERKPAQQSVSLDKAKIIVSVGRGMGSKENVKYAEELAKLLNGAVGGSRPVTAEMGWLPEDRQIGLSGNKVRPQLYIALGISGQPQHIAGIRDSKIIVAVNKDKNAPIAENCDYLVVGDAIEFCKVMIGRLSK